MLVRIMFLALIIIFSCKSNNQTTSGEQTSSESSVNKDGIGPISNLVLSEIDSVIAEKGKNIFEAKCSACHKINERFVGPALGDVTKRRSGAWIMNMILNPQEMTQKDPQAKELFAEYLVQMTNQNVSQDEARQLLEYLRSVEVK